MAGAGTPYEGAGRIAVDTTFVSELVSRLRNEIEVQPPREPGDLTGEKKKEQAQSPSSGVGGGIENMLPADWLADWLTG